MAQSLRAATRERLRSMVDSLYLSRLQVRRPSHGPHVSRKRVAVADETLRLHEYSPKFDPERFAAHERFFVGDVGAWARSRFGVTLPTARTAVFGVSAGGELALALGLRHPDRYGAIVSASPGGGYRPPDMMPSSLPRTYLVAGTQEPFFFENATRWADALRAADAVVVLSERVAGHDDAMWREEFPHHGPVFVLTHYPRASITMGGGTTYHFVTDGIHAALERATAAANGKDIRLAGGVAAIRQYLQAGLIDQLHLAISPILLGSGEHLLVGIDTLKLGYVLTEHVQTAKATHIVLTKQNTKETL